MDIMTRSDALPVCKLISKANFELLNLLKLDNLLTPGRRNGVYSMLEKIKEHANSHVTI